MTEQHRRAIDNSRRLAGLVAQERAEAIRQRISAGHTLLTLANTELQYSRVDQAKALLKRLRHLVEEVDFHLNEPKHVPATELEELRASLKNLDSKITALGESLKM
jgi:hypothetical protein